MGEWILSFFGASIALLTFISIFAAGMTFTVFNLLFGGDADSDMDGDVGGDHGGDFDADHDADGGHDHFYGKYTLDGDALTVSWKEGAKELSFQGKLDGDKLALTSDGKTREFERSDEGGH